MCGITAVVLIVRCQDHYSVDIVLGVGLAWLLCTNPGQIAACLGSLRFTTPRTHLTRYACPLFPSPQSSNSWPRAGPSLTGAWKGWRRSVHQAATRSTRAVDGVGESDKCPSIIVVRGVACRCCYGCKCAILKSLNDRDQQTETETDRQTDIVLCANSYPNNGRISTNRLKEQTGDYNNIYTFSNNPLLLRKRKFSRVAHVPLKLLGRFPPRDAGAASLVEARAVVRLQ
jgi:hypothetical protein